LLKNSNFCWEWFLQYSIYIYTISFKNIKINFKIGTKSSDWKFYRDWKLRKNLERLKRKVDIFIGNKNLFNQKKKIKTFYKLIDWGASWYFIKSSLSLRSQISANLTSPPYFSTSPPYHTLHRRISHFATVSQPRASHLATVSHSRRFSPSW